MKDYFDGNTKDYDTVLQTFIDKVRQNILRLWDNCYKTLLSKL